MIRGIVFDKDGTLFDFHATWGAWARSFLAAVARDGGHAAALARDLGFDPATGRFLPESRFVAGTPEQAMDDLCALLPEVPRARLVAMANDIAARTAQVEAAPLVPVLAELLARGLHLGLATNDTAANADLHLRAVGIRGAFGFVAGYDSGHGAKPGPGMLLAFAEAHRLDPAQVVMVGDSRHDLLAGRAAGMRAVAVLTGAQPAEALADLADAVLPHVGALPAWLRAQASDALAVPPLGR